MQHFVRKTALALALTAACTSAQAGIINYDFTVSIDTAGSALLGQNFSGSLSYDDSQVAGTGFDGEDLYALQDFLFEFDDALYSLSELFYAEAAVLNGNFLGLDAGALNFSFLPAIGPFAAAFAYDNGNDAGAGTISFAPAAAAPEPLTALLFAAGLAGLAGVSRRAR